MSAIEAEVSLLGSILIDNAVMSKVIDFLRPEDFSRQEHREVFDSCLALIRQGEQADMLTVTERLRNHGQLENVGGMAYVGQLAVDCFTTQNAVEHGRLIREYADRRRLVEACNSIIKNQREENSEQMRAKLALAIRSVEAGLSSSVISFAEAMNKADEWMEAAAQRRNAGGTIGVPFGLPCLDHIVGGMLPGQMWVIAARPGTGKSSFISQMGVQASGRGFPGLITSLEMSASELAIRALAEASGENVGKLFRGYKEERNRASEAVTMLMDRPLWLDTQTRTLDGILGRITGMKAKSGIAWASVDHVGLVSVSSLHGNRNDQIGAITGALKGLALRLQIPLVLVSQMSRSSEKDGRKPMLSDLRDSGNIEQDADGVIFMHREEKAEFGKPTRVEFGILKNRNGPAGFWLQNRIEFDGATQRFTEIAQ